MLISESYRRRLKYPLERARGKEEEERGEKESRGFLRNKPRARYKLTVFIRQISLARILSRTKSLGSSFRTRARVINFLHSFVQRSAPLKHFEVGAGPTSEETCITRRATYRALNTMLIRVRPSSKA